jgi:uridine kinase
MTGSGRDGIATAAALTLARPPLLGSVRLIAVDGPSGSGKTTLAAVLADRIAALAGGRVVRPARSKGPTAEAVARPDRPRTALSDLDRDPTHQETPHLSVPTVAVVSTDLLATWEEPLSWWPILEADLLEPLASGRQAILHVVQWISGKPRPGGHIVVPVVDVLVLEGVSAARNAVTNRLSVAVWVEVLDQAVRLERAVARDGEATRPYLFRWQKQEAEHFASDGTRVRADVVIHP